MRLIFTHFEVQRANWSSKHSITVCVFLWVWVRMYVQEHSQAYVLGRGSCCNINARGKEKKVIQKKPRGNQVANKNLS